MLAVIATMPGYKSRSTRIMLGEEAMTVDFVMDPVITPTNSFLQRGWSCSFPGPHLEVLFILVLVLVSVFLCFLLKRRVVLNYPKQRPIKRSVLGVWSLTQTFSSCDICKTEKIYVYDTYSEKKEPFSLHFVVIEDFWGWSLLVILIERQQDEVNSCH